MERRITPMIPQALGTLPMTELILTRDHAINKAQYDLTVMIRANRAERRRKRSDASKKGWAGR